MKSLIIFIALIFISSSSYAQTNNDSLKIAEGATSLPDSKDIIIGTVIKIDEYHNLLIKDFVNKNKRHTIRLYGLHLPKKGQLFYKDVQDFLKQNLSSEEVWVTIEDLDNKGNFLGDVELTSAKIKTIKTVDDPNSIVFGNINEVLLSRGLASLDMRFTPLKKWNDLQQSAKNAKRGIWSQESGSFK